MDPFHQDKETRALAAQHGIIYMAYSSLGTQWEGKLGHNPVFESDVLRTIAEKHGMSIAHIVISWVLQLGAAAIPRSTNPGHIAELNNFFVPGAPDQLRVVLDESDMQLIESLDGTLGDPW